MPRPRAKRLKRTTKQLLDEARPKAVADARRKAEIYTQAAGVALGAPLSISEESSPGPMMSRKNSAGNASSAPIAPGEETLRISISVSYEIKPKAP